MRKKFIAAQLLLASFAASAVEIPAPLGLTWGDSAEKITSKYHGEKVNSNKGLDFYVIKTPPVKIDDVSYYLGLVEPELGLVKLIIIKEISGDTYGVDGDKYYKSYKEKLTEKYGKSDSYEYMGKVLYKDPDEFYQCLNYDGCGSRTSFFQGDNGTSLSLELKGKSRGNGILQIDYESGIFSAYLAKRKKTGDEKINKGL